MLDTECLDRVYLNAYVPILQSSGQVVAFMTQHLGKPIPSPALVEHIGTRFRRSVESYASSNGIPWVKFGKDDRKIDVMQPHIQAQAASGRSGVAAVGVSQEFQRVWSGYQRDTKAAAPQYAFAKADRRVTCRIRQLRGQLHLHGPVPGQEGDRPGRALCLPARCRRRHARRRAVSLRRSDPACDCRERYGLASLDP